MNYKLCELLDVSQLLALLDSLEGIHNFPFAIYNRAGEPVITRGRQELLQKFSYLNLDGENSDSRENWFCRINQIETDLPVIYRGSLGLIDAAVKITIEDQDLGLIVAGKLFLERPDDMDFIQCASQCGIDEKDGLAIAREVPHVSKERLEKNLAFIRDMTQLLARQGLQDLRKAEADRQLEESTQNYRQIYENLQDVYYEVTLDGTILEVSPSVSRLSNYSRAELLGAKLDDLYVNPEERSAFLDTLLKKGCVRDYEIKLRGRSDEILYCSINSSLISDEDSHPVKIVGSIRDMTQRKITEHRLYEQIEKYESVQQRLEESEQRFKNIFLKHSAMMLLIDPENGRIIDANISAEMFYGYSREELLSLNIGQINMQSKEHLSRKMKHCSSGKKTCFYFKHKLASGEVRPVEVHSTPIQINGKTLLFSIIHDITERHRAEQELLKSEQNLKSFLANMPIALALIENEKDIIFRNRRFMDLFGYSEQDVPSVEEWWPAAYPDADTRRLVLETWNAAVQKSIKTGGDIESHEYPVTCQNGLVRNIEISGIMLEDKTLVTFIDVTERKRLEEERQTVAKLKSIGTLAGGLAHDFNNILAGLYGNISLAKARLSKDLPDHPGFRFINAAEKSMDSAVHLTKQLLTFAKGGEPVREKLNLARLVREAAQFNLSGSNIKLEMAQTADVWFAEVDKGQIQQVFSNLVINAKQAMPDGGSLRISLGNAQGAELQDQKLRGDYIRVTVADEGRGIPAENLSRIFDPYFTTKHEGHGLGLATAYSIVNRHGGKISVTSKLDKGTTFTIYLPASKAEKAHHEPSVNDPLEAKPSQKILLMDDNEVIRIAAKEMLSELSFNVVTADSGEQALVLFQQAFSSKNPFDLVILDLTVPGGMGGEKAAKKILKIDPHAKIIVSSGYSEDPIAANYSEHGFCGVMAKPYNLDTLSASLAKALPR